MVYYKANVEHIPTTDVIMVTQNPAGAIHASYIPFCFGHAFSPHSLLCMILACHITDIMIKKVSWSVLHHEQRNKHLWTKDGFIKLSCIHMSNMRVSMAFCCLPITNTLPGGSIKIQVGLLPLLTWHAVRAHVGFRRFMRAVCQVCKDHVHVQAYMMSSMWCFNSCLIYI